MKRKNAKKAEFVTTNITDPNQPYLQVVIGVLDRKGGLYIEMSPHTNTGVAIRGFTAAVNDSSPQNNIYKWPDDYELHALARFNPRTGELLPLTRPEVLATGEQVKIR